MPTEELTIKVLREDQTEEYSFSEVQKGIEAISTLTEPNHNKHHPFFSRRRSLLMGFTLALAVLAAATTVALAATFSNPASITINSSGIATPYPSKITVSGLTGTITDLNVTLHSLSHTFPDDVDVLLVGPGDRNVILMSDVGGGGGVPLQCVGDSVSNVTLTFDDEAAGELPDTAQITSGSYKPTQGTNTTNGFGGTCGNPRPATFTGPAPFPPYGTTLSVFDGADPNGTYSLYVFDDDAGSLGSIAGGWSLDMSGVTAPPPPPPPHHKKKKKKHHH